MLLRTDPQEARDRVSRTFFSMLDDALPDQFSADALNRARALGEAIFAAVLQEYAVPAPDSMTGENEDEFDVCNGAD